MKPFDERPVPNKQTIRKSFGKGLFEIVGRETPGRSFPSKYLSKGHGEWNHYYIRAINGEVRLWVNGEEVSGGTDCDPSTGYICLESEGSPILFRKIRVRELPYRRTGFQSVYSQARCLCYYQSHRSGFISGSSAPTRFRQSCNSARSCSTISG